MLVIGPSCGLGPFDDAQTGRVGLGVFAEEPRGLVAAAWTRRAPCRS